MRYLALAIALAGCAYESTTECTPDLSMTGSPGSQETVAFDLDGGESHALCIALDASRSQVPVTFRATEPFFPNATQLEIHNSDGSVTESDDEVGLLQFDVASGTKMNFLLTTTVIESLDLGVELRLEFRERR